MTVAQLQLRLGMYPPDYDVSYMYDGYATKNVDYVWMVKNGVRVILADGEEPVYADEDRPITAPSADTNRYWQPGGE